MMTSFLNQHDGGKPALDRESQVFPYGRIRNQDGVKRTGAPPTNGDDMKRVLEDQDESKLLIIGPKNIL